MCLEVITVFEPHQQQPDREYSDVTEDTPREAGRGDDGTSRPHSHLRNGAKAVTHESERMEDHPGGGPGDDGSREWCRRPSSPAASAPPTVNPRFIRGETDRSVSENSENNQPLDYVALCECGGKMHTTSYRTTRQGTLYAIACDDCGATGGVRDDGATFGAVAAPDDAGRGDDAGDSGGGGGD